MVLNCTNFLQSGFAGTIIDNKVCHPRNNDFYLCAHAGMIVSTLIFSSTSTIFTTYFSAIRQRETWLPINISVSNLCLHECLYVNFIDSGFFFFSGNYEANPLPRPAGWGWLFSRWSSRARPLPVICVSGWSNNFIMSLLGYLNRPFESWDPCVFVLQVSA